MDGPRRSEMSHQTRFGNPAGAAGRRWMGLMCLACALGCSEDDDETRREITADAVYNPAIDFSSYRTFAFRDESEADQDMVAELGEERQRVLALVDRQIDIELRQIGLERAAPEEATCSGRG